MRFISFFIFVFTILLTGCRTSLRLFKGMQSRPNILLIMTDDAAWEDFGFATKTSNSVTPNLDALCQEGAFFTSAYAAGSIGDASVAAILTGCHPVEMDYEYGTENLDRAVDAKFCYLPSYLPKYRSIFIGKWHLGGQEKEADRPYSRGFEEFYGFIGGGSSYLPWNMQPFNSSQLITHLRFRSSDDTFPGAKEAKELLPLIEKWSELNLEERQKARKLTLTLNLSALEDSEEGYSWPRFTLPYDVSIASKKVNYKYSLLPLKRYLTDELSNKAVEFITDLQRLKDPWLAVVAYNAPHSPREAHPKKLQEFLYVKDEDQRVRMAMISSLDDGVGAIVKALKATGQWDNTLIIFLNDNGMMQRRQKVNRWVFRGGKGTLFEGGFHVPMVMVWPKEIPAGITINQAVSTLDIVPTCVELGQGRNKKNQEIFREKEQSLIAIIQGMNLNPNRTFYWRQGKIAAIKEGDWKLIQVSPLDEDEKENQEETFLLYNLKNDPRETNNVVFEELEILDHLQQKLNAWIRQYPEHDCQNVLFWERQRQKAHLEEFNDLN